MSLEAQIHRLVLDVDGVGIVYAADPLWLAAAKQLGGLLTSGSEPAGGPFVVCTEEGRPRAEAVDTLRDNHNPDTDMHTSVGPGEISEEQLLDDMRPIVAVRVRIGTDGSAAAPVVAKMVAAQIRSFVSIHRPGLDVKALVEIAAIDV